VRKDLNYYSNLKYDTVLRPIEDEDGPFYQATTRELDPKAFYGVGKSPQEAIDSLTETKNQLFEYYLERGYSIAEPEPQEEERYSGKFVLRVPPVLHGKLTRAAKKSEQSLNAYVASILEQYTTAQDIVEFASMDIANKVCSTEIMQVWRETWDVQIDHLESTNFGKKQVRMVG
jgi:antitoxin HicB